MNMYEYDAAKLTQLQAGNVEFGTQSVVRLSMRVTVWIHLILLFSNMSCAISVR